MPVTLFGAPLSPQTARLRMQVRAKGLAGAVAFADDPDGAPRLDTGDGVILHDAEVIAEYLEDRFYRPALRGEGALGMAKVRGLCRLVEATLVPGFKQLFAEFDRHDRRKTEVDQAFHLIDQGLRQIEPLLEGPVYACQNRLTLTDCALAPALFCMAIAPAFGRQPFEGFAIAEDYYARLTARDPHCATTIEDMADALTARMRQGG